MEELPSFYAVIPANVRYCKEINANEKLLFAEITALTQSTGICWASNNYFASLFDCTPQAISKWIKNLVKNEFIICEYEYKNGTKEVSKRLIKGINNSIKGINCGLGGYQHTIKGNNTSINNKESKGTNVPKQKFICPTLEDIIAYIKESGLNVDANKFFQYYSVSNWKDNRDRQVKNWKLKLVSWNNNTSTKKHSQSALQDLPMEERMIEAERIRQEKILATMEREYGL